MVSERRELIHAAAFSGADEVKRRRAILVHPQRMITIHPQRMISILPQRKPNNPIATQSSRSIPQRIPNLEQSAAAVGAIAVVVPQWKGGAPSIPIHPQRVRSNKADARSLVRSASSMIPQRNLSSEQTVSVADPHRKAIQGIRQSLPIIHSPVQVIAIAVPQWNLFTQKNYNPEDLENSHRISSLQSEILNLKQREQYSDSTTVVVSVDLQKLNERIAKLSGGVVVIQDCTTHELYESNSIPKRELYCFSDFHFAVTTADPPPLLVVVVRDCVRNHPRMASTSSSSSSKPPPPASSSSNPPSPVGNVDGIAQTCSVKFREEAIFVLYTPLIVSLASGNLKVETFRHCISQDVYFLEPFATAFEFAEAYVVDNEAKDGIKELRKITRKKIQCVPREWRSDLIRDDATPNSATSKCTNFFLAITSGKIDGIKPSEKTKLAAYILGAITSCIRLNAYIGKEVREFFCERETNHRYKKWIESYSSDSYQDFCLQTEKLLDNLSVALTGEELGIIERLYCQGIKHETEFLLAQPVIEKAVVPLSGEHNQVMIFLGFDLTCSFVDSCAILAELTIATAPKSDQIPIENQFARMTLSDLRDNWEVIADKYIDGYEQCIEKLLLATEKVKKLNRRCLVGVVGMMQRC